ncbi:hypothetical protein RI543_002403 [Arxiozyma heterogenica]|uniref:Uncharacterized protein n=1 Tax=Arxiozyma heterogenica TaxID=278026 RepID=A0AAN8A8P6_9SACH|nr:hypothetical protein RI543_002403 [Kazachstania heterogenica]
MDSHYALSSTNQCDKDEDRSLCSLQLYTNNIDELLKSPLVKSSEPCVVDRHSSSSFLVDYKDLYDINHETNDNLYNLADHIAEMNYKVWLSSKMVNI